MADLGAKAIDFPTRLRCVNVPVMSTAIYKPASPGDAKLTDFDLSGTISGTVVLNTVPQGGVRVGLMHRSNFNTVAQMITDGAGAYAFKFLDITDIENYFVVFLDPMNASPWAYSLVRDHLSPG